VRQHRMPSFECGAIMLETGEVALAQDTRVVKCGFNPRTLGIGDRRKSLRKSLDDVRDALACTLRPSPVAFRHVS